MRRFGWFLFLFMMLIGCGYKPTNLYTKKVLGESIYVDVSISKVDPQNSVLITDAINEAVISKFRANLVRDKKRASSQLYLSLGSVSFKPIQYDENGYVIAYKTYVSLKSRYIDRYKKQHSITTTGNYDFNIEANSIISDNKRFEAIKEASLSAIDELISKISIKGSIDEHK